MTARIAELVKTTSGKPPQGGRMRVGHCLVAASLLLMGLAGCEHSPTPFTNEVRALYNQRFDIRFRDIYVDMRLRRADDHVTTGEAMDIHRALLRLQAGRDPQFTYVNFWRDDTFLMQASQGGVSTGRPYYQQWNGGVASPNSQLIASNSSGSRKPWHAGHALRLDDQRACLMGCVTRRACNEPRHHCPQVSACYSLWPT